MVMSMSTLVVGASGGVGSAIVEQLLAHGETVVAVGRSLEKLKERFSAQAKEQLLLVEANCATPAGARHAVAQANSRGEIHALVNAAGTTLIAAAHRTTEDDYRAVMAANVDTSFHLLSAYADHLREAKHPGRLVLFSSIVARIGVSNHEAIAAAKGAVEALTRSASATYAPLGLAVNAIALGITDTPLAAPLLKSDAVREAVAKQYPLQGIGDPADVASLVMWLLSPAGRRMNGQVLTLDAGFTAVRPLVR
jgi:NAD(P)-dependent dehydrogenase (short-subunit alcohol dehydrogenase family)